MPSSTTTIPFNLGAYLGNPNGSDAPAEAVFDAQYNGFVSDLGTKPTYLDTFVDYTQPTANWVGNAGWTAWSTALSPAGKTVTPVVGLPMASTNASAGSSDAQYQAIASGADDSVYKGIVQAYAANGFANVVFRPGWEMNLQGPTFAGATAQSQADWVSAFQRIYTVLHQQAASSGINVTVDWNPGIINYSNVPALTSLYPGNSYVDGIGADIYSVIHPYSDGNNANGQPTYHDWDTGQEDTSVAQFIADPINRAHYWTYPAGTRYSNDGSGGHALSLGQLLTFAQAQGKPFAIPETGAGDSTAGADVADDAAFPSWLASQLSAAKAAGEPIQFVNLWDSNSGGNYAFSNASDGKPAEAAAWAQAFGPQAATSLAAAAPPGNAAASVGAGPDILALSMAEDAWQGDAQFTVSVDGAQVGGVQTATAARSAGQTQTLNVLGTFGPGNHTVGVNFLNDAYGGTTATDRNLYVQGATFDGAAVPSSALNLMSGGVQSFSFGQPASSSPDTLSLQVSEDAWQGDAQYTVSVNGTTVGGVRTATASHGAGAVQTVSIAGNWGASPTLGITFINDAYGGTAATDRNLYVNGATYDGQALSGAPATLLSNGTVTLKAPAGSTALTLHLQEDAWNGDAQYAVAVDGTTLVQNSSVTALHSRNQSQAVNLQALLTPGTHDVAVSFLNDAYGGTPTTDRNLYVTGIDVNGRAAAGTAAALYSTGTQHVQIVVPSS